MNSESDGRRYLPSSETCFICGEENAAGLQGRFYVEGGKVKLPIQAGTHHCGYHNTVHGGVIAAAVDECMGWSAACAIGRMCYTAELNVRYLRPLTLDAGAVAETEVVHATLRLVRARGEVVGADGTVYARAEGKFMPLTAEQTLEVDDALVYRGDELRIFDALRKEMG
jgi:uncharacterized protein (TIGR00369 family)